MMKSSAGNSVLNVISVTGAYIFLLVGAFGMIVTIFNPLNIVGILFYLIIGTSLLLKFSVSFQKFCIKMLPMYLLVTLRER